MSEIHQKGKQTKTKEKTQTFLMKEVQFKEII